jgi:nitrite reductase/ring-hydroxylating ferredoxin subunit
MVTHHIGRRSAAQHQLIRMERREFLQTTGCFLGALSALGLSKEALAALPVSIVNGSGDTGERRYPIPTADVVNIDRQASLIVVRFQNRVYAFALSCPHENAAVKWLPKDHRFQCTKHDSKYQPDGQYTSGRSTRNMDRFALRREEPSIVVDLHHWFQSDKDANGWASAFLQL